MSGTLCKSRLFDEVRLRDMQTTYIEKSNRQSRKGLLLVLLVVLIIVVSTAFKSYSLNQKNKELEITQAHLERELEEANNKSEELLEREKYMKTKKYIEDEAKNKLGLVNKDEILIKPKEKD